MSRISATQKSQAHVPDKDSITKNGVPCLERNATKKSLIFHTFYAINAYHYMNRYIKIIDAIYYISNSLFGDQDFFENRTFTICQENATAPTISIVSPMRRAQRKFCNKGCCINSSLRANHKPCVTLAQL